MIQHKTNRTQITIILLFGPGGDAEVGIAAFRASVLDAPYFDSGFGAGGGGPGEFHSGGGFAGGLVGVGANAG